MSNERRTKRDPTLTDRIVHELANRIFLGEYAPGERFPPTRELAEQLGTDRTSLRIAIERLKQMGVVSVVQGSGVTVNDLHREAGVGFLNEIFRGPEDTSHESILLQTLEFVTALNPGLVALAARRANPELLRKMDAMLAIQEELADDPAAVADAAIEAEDMLARSVGNLVVSLVYNATRPLRREFLRRVFATVDVHAHVAQHRSWMRQLMLGSDDVETIVAQYRAWQERFHQQARAALVEIVVPQEDGPTETPN